MLREPNRRRLGESERELREGVDAERLSGVAGLLEQLAARRAQSWLGSLMDQVGAVGITASASAPALSAAIDQHAAEVRDVLLFGVEGSGAAAGAVLLAGYAKGLLDEAGIDMGRLHASVGERLRHAEWLTLRLVAVCALSRSDEWREPAGALLSAPAAEA